MCRIYKLIKAAIHTNSSLSYCVCESIYAFCLSQVRSFLHRFRIYCIQYLATMISMKTKTTGLFQGQNPNRPRPLDSCYQEEALQGFKSQNQLGQSSGAGVLERRGDDLPSIQVEDFQKTNQEREEKAKNGETEEP